MRKGGKKKVERGGGGGWSGEEPEIPADDIAVLPGRQGMRVVIENLDTAPTPTQTHANKTQFTHTSVVKDLDDTRPLAILDRLRVSHTCTYQHARSNV